MTKLTDIVQVRVTPELKQAVWEEATRLKLRPADVVRFAIAILCAGEKVQPYATGGKGNGNNKSKSDNSKLKQQS